MQYFFLIINMNYFWSDATETLAKTKTLKSSRVRTDAGIHGKTARGLQQRKIFNTNSTNVSFQTFPAVVPGSTSCSP